jgi:hypothetical protein
VMSRAPGAQTSALQGRGRKSIQFYLPNSDRPQRLPPRSEAGWILQREHKLAVEHHPPYLRHGNH